MVVDRFIYHRPKKGLFLSTFQSAKDIIRSLTGCVKWLSNWRQTWRSERIAGVKAKLDELKKQLSDILLK